MSTAIDELITQNVADTLAAATDMAVRRDGQMPQSAADGDCVVVRGEAAPMDEYPCGFDQYRLKIGIACYAIASETETVDTVDDRLAGMASEVRRALREDLHRGGLADNTKFDVADRFFTQNCPPAVLVTIHVQYRTLFADPYRQS